MKLYQGLILGAIGVGVTMVSVAVSREECTIIIQIRMIIYHACMIKKMI